jgi:hypothetical protein
MAPSPPGTVSGRPEADSFPGLPGLPVGEADPAQPRAVSLADNVETGQQAVASSHLAVFVNGSGLDMGPAGNTRNGWAIWRWGTFQNGNVPRELHTDVTINAQSSYWVLLADYTLQRWQVLGPLTGGTQSFTLTPDDSYLSPAANAYVALFITDNNKLTVNTLDLVCDNDAQPPAPPTGLTTRNVTVRAAVLEWNAPEAPDLNHYELYSGAANGFGLSDAGTTLLSDTIGKAAEQFTLSGLLPETTYFLRMRAVDAAGNASELSTTVTFKTKPNGPPVPAFVYHPGDVQKNISITFDPGPTTDADDLDSALTCAWDWENDGTDDTTYTGLGTTEHIFTATGPVTVKLTVSDGVDSVSTSQNFIVGQNLETRVTGYALGSEGVEVVGAAVDYASGRIAAVVRGGGGKELRYFDGAGWSTYSMDSLSAYAFGGVALGPGGRVGVVLFDQTAFDLTWTVWELQGANWALVQEKALSGERLSSGAALSYAPNGRMTVAFTHAFGPPFGQNPKFTLTVYHQLPSDQFLASNCYSNVYPGTPFNVARNDGVSVCVFPDAGGLSTNTVDDSGGTIVSQTAVSGTVTQIVIGSDPVDDTHVFWDALTGSGIIYYGDNYGTPTQPAQGHIPAVKPFALLGAGPAPDNQGLFYWAELENTDETWIRGYDTASATPYTIGHGTGLCDAGFGGWYRSGANDGIYTVTSEVRDGEVTGYLLNGSSIVQQETIAQPGSGTPLGSKSLAFITNGGGLAVLNRQENPTALLHTAPSVGGAFTTSQLGIDTWAFPDCAASGTVPGDYLLGSFYRETNLVLYYFPPGAVTGTYLDTYADANAARLQYNPVTNQTMLVYTQNGGTTLVSRLWDGLTLSGPSVINTGGKINEIVLRARPDGEWGVAWDDINSNVLLAETAGGAWQPANTLSTDVLHLAYGSIGLEYASNGDAALAVERGDPNTGGLYFGLKPSGGTAATWTLAAASPGFSFSSINVHFRSGTDPVIVCYDNTLGVQYAQFEAGSWNISNLPFYIKGNPLVSVMDASGTLAVAGKDNASGKSAVCFLSQ